MVIKSINQFFGKNSRWIFGIFTVVIIISFMGFLTPGTFGGCGMGTAGEAGTAFGKSVTYSKLAEIRLYQSILTGFARDISVEEAFGMCCMEEAAGRRGISASDKEVAEFIIAMFSAEGKFNKEAYDNYLKTVKERYGITSSEFNNAVRLAIVVDKLQKDVAASVIVTDDEIESFYKVLYSKINEKRLHLKYSDYQDKVSVSDEEAAAFLKDNQKNYRIPARTKALLACFEYNDPALVAEADKMITEEAMKNYYEQNTTRFTVNSGKDSVITPYDKARESVRINLRDENIKKIALRKAQDFARDVYDAASEDVKNCGVIFKDYVSRNNIKNIAIPYFSAADTKLGTVESAALAQEIIESVSDVPVSNAVVANNGVYVGYAYDFEAERDAKLAEVKDRVVKDLRADKARKMAEAECDKIYTELAVLSKEELAKKIEADKRFAAVEPYMFMAQAKDFAESLIRMKTFMMEEGELSEKVSVLDGVVLTYVVQRALPDMKDFAEHKAALEMSYKQQKEYTAWNEFQAYLSSQCAMNQ